MERQLRSAADGAWFGLVALVYFGLAAYFAVKYGGGAAPASALGSASTPLASMVWPVVGLGVVSLCCGIALAVFGLGTKTVKFGVLIASAAAVAVTLVLGWGLLSAPLIGAIIPLGLGKRHAGTLPAH